MYSVKETARNNPFPTESDEMNMKRITRHLKGVPSAKCLIEIIPFPQSVNVYSDSDWAGQPMTCKSTSGGVVQWGSSTTVSERQVRRSRTVCPDNWSCRRDFLERTGTLSDSREPCRQSICEGMGIQTRVANETCNVEVLVRPLRRRGSMFDVLRTHQLSYAASQTSRRVRVWRGTTPTAAESCPAELPHFLSWASPGGRAGLETSIAWALPRTSLLACTGAHWWVPVSRRLGGFRVHLITHSSFPCQHEGRDIDRASCRGTDIHANGASTSCTRDVHRTLTNQKLLNKTSHMGQLHCFLSLEPTNGHGRARLANEGVKAASWPHHRRPSPQWWALEEAQRHDRAAAAPASSTSPIETRLGLGRFRR